MALPFQGLQSKKRNQIVAIDLGSRTTKAVCLQRRGSGYELLAFEMQEAVAADKGSGHAKLTEHLKKIWQDLGARTKQVVMAVGVGDSLLRHAELPLVPVSDMRQMLKFNAKSYLQQDLPDHVYDCFVLPPKAGPSSETLKPGQKCRVLVGAARRQVVSDLQAAAKAAGLAVEMIVPGLIGPANAFELAQPEVFAKEVVALVDIGYKNTTITVLANGELLLTRVVGIGAEKVTTGLAEAMGVSYAEAEGMKQGVSADVEMTMMPLLIPLGRELQASIQFFEHQHDKVVNEVFISGGSARSEFIVKTLKEEMMLETKTWNPLTFAHLALSPKSMGEIESVTVQLAVATGAALAAF